MSYLIYCVFESHKADKSVTANHGILFDVMLDKQKREDLLGVNDQPVSVISKNGLSAAFSEVIHLPTHPQVQQILAFEKVIEAFYHESPVLPMRYGSFFKNENEILLYLEKWGTRYEVLLKEVEGMTEMGIRVYFQQTDRKNNHKKPSWWNGQEGAEFQTGCAYLSARINQYDEIDRIALEQNVILENICKSLKGLYAQCRKESSLLGAKPLLSLYFLLPKGSIEAFREVFRHTYNDIQKENSYSTKLLLSGPWPPYNFVQLNERNPDPCGL